MKTFKIIFRLALCLLMFASVQSCDRSNEPTDPAGKYIGDITLQIAFRRPTEVTWMAEGSPNFFARPIGQDSWEPWISTFPPSNTKKDMNISSS